MKVVCHSYPHLCTNFGTLTSMFENCNNICNHNFWILTVHYSFLQYSQTSSETSSLTLMKSYGKSVIINRYVSDHILYLKIEMPSVSWHTSLQLLEKVLHIFNNGFLQQSSSALLQCILQLGNCFAWYSMIFVAVASSKDVGYSNDVTTTQFLWRC